LLTDKRIVAAQLPVSLRPSKDRRYRVTDPYLRFWLHLLGPRQHRTRLSLRREFSSQRALGRYQ
jgi:AAA+ ATPase superfamily predicted ATPase